MYNANIYIQPINNLGMNKELLISIMRLEKIDGCIFKPTRPMKFLSRGNTPHQFVDQNNLLYIEDDEIHLFASLFDYPTDANLLCRVSEVSGIQGRLVKTEVRGK